MTVTGCETTSAAGTIDALYSSVPQVLRVAGSYAGIYYTTADANKLFPTWLEIGNTPDCPSRPSTTKSVLRQLSMTVAAADAGNIEALVLEV
jgi:hypothetical protein